MNTCVYSSMNGAEAAYLGKFGTDQVAECVQNALSKLHIAMDRCRHFEGENGFACVKIVENERVFVGSNRGGVAVNMIIILMKKILCISAGSI